MLDLQYACVRTFPDTLGHQKDFTMTTMAIVLITVFLLGGTTELALKIFEIDTDVDEHTYMRETLREPIVSSRIRNFGGYKMLSCARSLGFLANDYAFFACRLQNGIVSNNLLFETIAGVKD